MVPPMASAPAPARSPAPTSTPRTDGSIRPGLAREWAALRRRPDVLHQVASWGLSTEPITDLDQVLRLAGTDVPTTPATERVLRRLVELARTDDLAGRVVLHRMLPGLLGVVRRRRGPHGVDGVLEELVGAAWITIRTFDPARRPGCLVAALVSSTEHRAFKAAERRSSSTEATVEPHRFDRRIGDPVRPCALEELAAVLAAARRTGLPDDDLEFVRRLVVAGSPSVLAAELGVTTRTIRNRRDQVTYRLRQLVSAA